MCIPILEINVCLEIVGRISTYMFDILLHHHVCIVMSVYCHLLQPKEMKAIHRVVSTQ